MINGMGVIGFVIIDNFLAVLNMFCTSYSPSSSP